MSSAQIEGYAGLYDSADDEIQISEDLDEQIIVHEAAHAWFNGGLFAQRWISEGLADEYAARVIAAEGRDGRRPGHRSSVRDKAAFRLNDWPPPSRVDATTDGVPRPTATTRHGRSSRSIVDEVGEARMRDVFAAAAAHTVTYVGSGPAETSAPAVADWRRFLDLVEDVGGVDQGGRAHRDVGRDRRPDDRSSPPGRPLASATPPWSRRVRAGCRASSSAKPMSDWQFDTANEAMTAAEAVLADRDRLSAETTELGLAFPAALEPAYETAATATDLDDARRADRDLAQGGRCGALGTRRAGRRARPAGHLGLIGTRPEAAYGAALAAFAAGDDSGAVAGSSAAVAALSGAEEIGRGRTLAVGAGVIVVAARAAARRLAPAPGPPSAARDARAGGAHRRIGARVGCRRADVDGRRPIRPVRYTRRHPGPGGGGRRCGGAEPD